MPPSKHMRNRARNLRRDQTPAKERLRHALRRKQLGGIRFRRQQAIGPYIVDFLCASHKLIAELDGSVHEYTFDYDEERTQWLKREGYTVIRFGNSYIMTNLDGALYVIGEIISGVSPGGFEV